MRPVEHLLALLALGAAASVSKLPVNLPVSREFGAGETGSYRTGSRLWPEMPRKMPTLLKICRQACRHRGILSPSSPSVSGRDFPVSGTFEMARKEIGSV